MTGRSREEPPHKALNQHPEVAAPFPFQQDDETDLTGSPQLLGHKEPDEKQALFSTDNCFLGKLSALKCTFMKIVLKEREVREVKFVKKII